MVIMYKWFNVHLLCVDEMHIPWEMKFIKWWTLINIREHSSIIKNSSWQIMNIIEPN